MSLLIQFNDLVLPETSKHYEIASQSCMVGQLWKHCILLVWQVD